MISAPTHGAFLNSAGEELKVNRPKAERGHPGVCPSRLGSLSDFEDMLKLTRAFLEHTAETL